MAADKEAVRGIRCWNIDRSDQLHIMVTLEGTEIRLGYQRYLFNKQLDPPTSCQADGIRCICRKRSYTTEDTRSPSQYWEITLIANDVREGVRIIPSAALQRMGNGKT